MDFRKASLAELRKYAKEKGIRNISSMKKLELANLLEDVERMTSKRDEQPQDDEQRNVPEKAAQEQPSDTGSQDKQSKAGEGVQEKPKRARTRNVQDKPKSDDGSTQDKQTDTKTYKQSEETGAVQEKSQYEGRTSSRGRYSQTESRGQYDKKNQYMRADTRPAGGPRRQAPAATTDRNYQEQRNLEPESPDVEANIQVYDGQEYNADLDSGEEVNGILEVMSDGYGFIRSANYLPGDRDIYVSPVQIRKFAMKKGDVIGGPIRLKTQGEKFSALLFIRHINGMKPSEAAKRVPFEELTPIFPNERIKLDAVGAPIALRIVDLLSPIGKGQRGMIVSPPKAGKTTLLKAIAKSISANNKDMHLIVLLIDERPEEVTDMKESIEGENVEVVYSTFDELPEHHKRVSEMVIERAKRLVEHGNDVVILLDSITRLARAYNLTVPPSGRTLSGGLDPAALHMPKRFFGAARNMREGGSLTVLATALVETGSRMDDVVFEEFKGTGNMELVLDRKLSERRIFPAIDIAKSGTRRDDLLLNAEEQEVVNGIHKALSGSKAEEMIENVLRMFVRTKNNREFVEYMKKTLLTRR